MKSKIAALLTATAVSLASCTSGTTGTGGDSTGSAPAAVTSSNSPPDGSSVASSTSVSTSSMPPADSTSPPAETAPASPTSSGDVNDEIPVDIPATITGANLEGATQGVAVWRNAVRVLDQSLQDPGGKDWKPVIYRYLNDPAATRQLALINTFVKQDIHQVGDTGYTAKVFEANDHSIKIRACLDHTRYDVVGADGKSVLKEGSLDRLRRDYWLGHFEGSDAWFVDFVDIPDPAEPC